MTPKGWKRFLSRLRRLPLRLNLKEKQWQEAIATVGQLRSLHPTAPEGLTVTELRAEALRGWTQELLDKGQPAPSSASWTARRTEA